MGMDISGKSPKNDVGVYFRNNIWWWRPLWDYCCILIPKLGEEVDGTANGGDGLDDEGATSLGLALLESVQIGMAEDYRKQYYQELSNLPLETCFICSGTGQRPDGLYGEKWNKPGCNGCDSLGTTPNFATNYPFSVENVEEFAKFLVDSGGFEIW